MQSQDDGLCQYLDALVLKFEHPGFILFDPISIPHRYTRKADIEISGFFAAIFSWGQRVTIINKTGELMELMGESPLDYILHHRDKDLKKLLDFKHRTFQTTDLLYFIRFLKFHYSKYPSLEHAFVGEEAFSSLEKSLNHFRNYFFSLEDYPVRTIKHISYPLAGSTCKRLCMYLRWMVRSNKKGVDFGIWKSIKAAELKIPLDVHVHRVARKFNLLHHDKSNWQSVIELTDRLKTFDHQDPVKYDFALFNLGVSNIPLQ